MSIGIDIQNYNLLALLSTKVKELFTMHFSIAVQVWLVIISPL